MAELVRHYLISGRVQGVGYRAFSVRGAREFGVRGWARNLVDGRVEILATAPADNLARFEAHLRRGPAHGRVSDIARADWPPGDHDCNVEFDVRKDAAAPCSATPASGF